MNIRVEEETKDAFQWHVVHRFLTQGKSDDAQKLLAQMIAKTPVQRNELSYMQAWYAATQNQWETVAQHMSDFSGLLMNREEKETLLTQGSVRRRRPMLLLRLGEMAHMLHYPDEAMEHLRHCLRLLNERRMNVPEVRLMAHENLGRLALEMNRADQALQQFETASLLCREREPGPALYATILAGLCETQFCLKQYELALTSGKQALRLLQATTPPDCHESLLLLLSRISLALGENVSALEYVQNARRSASQTRDAARVASILLVLAEIRKQEHQRQEARANCKEALSLLATIPEHPLYGSALFLSGKIAEAEWCSHPDEDNIRDAQAYYEQALKLFTDRHDTAAITRVSRQLAQLLEAAGQPELALVHWKRLFLLSSQPKP
jgi:tetratricopeptide (TPR) repeat protein